MECRNIDTIRPLVIAYGYPEDPNQIAFLCYENQITVYGCNELLNELLPLCNGTNDFGDILKKFSDKYDGESLAQLVRVLLENEILIDSREFYLAFHKCSMNPPRYFYELSEQEAVELFGQSNHKVYRGKKRVPLSTLSEINSGFLEFSMQRKSGWKYASRDISFTKLSGILKAAYGITRREFLSGYEIIHRTVPSGGALYPLELYLVTLTDTESLGMGLYYFDKEAEHLVQLKGGDFHSQLQGILLEASETIETASLILVITARFSRECQKYSNRGYRHILLEAGHLAQNVYLYCIDQNLDTVELSCFLDEPLCNFLEICPRHEATVTLLAVGVR